MNRELEILRAIANGKQDALHQLYELFAKKVYNTAISYIQNQEDAEEIVQDVFIVIYKNASKFKNKSSVSTWIYRITVNTALNYIKKKKRYAIIHTRKNEYQQLDFEHPGVLMQHKEEVNQLFFYIKQLPEKQKIAFILSFIEGLPRQEVAVIMKTSLKAVESLLQRAKHQLRKKITT